MIAGYLIAGIIDSRQKNTKLTLFFMVKISKQAVLGELLRATEYVHQYLGADQDEKMMATVMESAKERISDTGNVEAVLVSGHMGQAFINIFRVGQ